MQQALDFTNSQPITAIARTLAAPSTVEDVKQERDIARVYRSVDAAWGTPNPRKDLPPFPDGMARRVLKALYLHIMEEPFTGMIDVKHKGRSWVYRTYAIVNTARGWWLAVHDLSHDLHKMKHPDLRPHDAKHAYLERAMIGEIVRRGWLDEAKERSSPKPKAKRNLQAERQANVLACLSTWERKKRRAEAAIKKLKKRARYYDQRLADATVRDGEGDQCPSRIS